MITHERLRYLYRYDRRGWLKRVVNAKKTKYPDGRPIGKGYRGLTIEGRTYYMHRLVWFYFNGTWPVQIDHKDGNKENNKRGNLRECTAAQNQHNSPPKRGTRSGVKGVFPGYAGKWMVLIVINGKQTYKGTFATIKEAAAAYNKAARHHFGKFARLNKNA